MNPFEPDVPEDFDSFWEEIVLDARAVPLDFRRQRAQEAHSAEFVVEEISFRASEDRTLNGWLAYPPGARRLPAFLWIPPYGRESVLPNAFGTRAGMASMSLNFHGLGPFHREAYSPARGYFADGIALPGTWIFRRMAVDAMVALRVLRAQSEVDEERVGVMGLSQGGGMAIWMGAFSGIVRAVVADLPFLGAMRYALQRNAYRYPLKEIADFIDRTPLGREMVLHTLSYFDTVNVATRCAVPTLVSLGTKDPACRPETVEAIYRALPGPKELVRYEWGHDYHPQMIETNRRWLLRSMGAETSQSGS